MLSKTYAEKADISNDMLFLKVGIGVLPALIVSALGAAHHRIVFSIALFVGALLQYPIPPRKHIVLTVLGSLAIALLYAIWPRL